MVCSLPSPSRLSLLSPSSPVLSPLSPSSHFIFIIVFGASCHLIRCCCHCSHLLLLSGCRPVQPTPAFSSCPQLRLSPTLLPPHSFHFMTFMMTQYLCLRPMPGITAIPPPSQLYTPSSSLPFGRSPLGGPLWEVPSGRWEVVFYLVRFALLTLCLWPWRCSQKCHDLVSFSLQIPQVINEFHDLTTIFSYLILPPTFLIFPLSYQRQRRYNIQDKQDDKIYL